MKLFLLYFSVGFLLVLLQTSLLHMLPLGPVAPDLTLVLCVYWAFNRPTVGTVLGSFLMGYTVDVFSSPILGIHAFAMSLVFLVTYLISRQIWARSPLLSAAIVFVAAWVKVIAMSLIWAIFFASKAPWTGVLRYVFIEALTVALLAPAFFYLLRWGESQVQKVRSVP